MNKKEKSECIDFSKLEDFNKIEVSVGSKKLPFRIGDKMEFPLGNPILKTIAGIQINESGIATYLLEWYEDDAFKQYWVSLTELKILRDNMKKRNSISFSD